MSEQSQPQRLRRFVKLGLAIPSGLILVVAFGIGCFGLTGAINRWRFSEAALSRLGARTPLTFYISSFGSDTNPGTSPQRAWKTITRINRQSFVPGDAILFDGSQQFTGNLVLARRALGTRAHPIRIGSFGSGRATILATSSNAILVKDTGGIEIRDLNLIGSGHGENGIILYNDLLGGVKIPYIRIESVEASGFARYGIAVAGNIWKSGFRDVRITHTSVHNNLLAGIYVYGTYGRFFPVGQAHSHSDIYIADSVAFDNSGVEGKYKENSGSGIVLSDIDRGTIERSTAHHNGFLSNSSIGGPVGIWAWDADSVTIQYNRSFDNRSGGPKDGGGFDLDGSVTNSVLQYNESANNDGAGYLLCQFPNGGPTVHNTVRYNLSVNDARKNSYGAIELFGGVRQAEIYNNTVLLDPAHSGSSVALRIVDATEDIHLRNNLFYVGKALSILRVDPMQKNILLQGNAYVSADPHLSLEWQNARYDGLAPFQAGTGQEMLGSRSLGVEAHPASADLSGSPRLLPLELRPVLKDAALDLRYNFGLDPGPRDLCGSAISTAAGVDIGAQQLDASECRKRYQTSTSQEAKAISVRLQP